VIERVNYQTFTCHFQLVSHASYYH